MKSLIQVNNLLAMNAGKAQYVLLPSTSAKTYPEAYEEHALRLRNNKRLTEVQVLNIEMNLQLIEMARATREVEE